ncbi:NAD(P)-dependent alcohol dehydrogenase [Nocardioides eburneiflavus]|uniref:NAD(P)-dependent alcohol dehydrogenase n=1 Tax=Nocardioides eburneiflavus TaxID=2518372 RepID=UPI001FEC6725|nr:NAD(P)-dependent alcohol dehydrogenase [Nocardioides eburneiflavus]
MTPAAGRAVRQLRYGGPEVLDVTRQPAPVPACGQVRVGVHAASLNARDWHVMRGEPRVARLLDRGTFGRRAPRELVRGTDLAGIVDAVGDGVTRWKVGDPVFGEGSGAFADYALASEDQLWVIPAGVSFAEAASLPLAASTAVLCLDETGLGEGGSVLINGASGGVGTFAVQLAKTLGSYVTAVVSPRNADLARSLGADEVIDYTASDFTRAGQTYDAVVDFVGNRTLRELRATVRPGGRLVLSGGGVAGEGRILGPMRLLMGALAVARLQPFEIRFPQAVPTSDGLRRISQMVESGAVRPVVDQTFALEDVTAAIRYMEGTHARAKVVITVT